FRIDALARQGGEIMRAAYCKALAPHNRARTFRNQRRRGSLRLAGDIAAPVALGPSECPSHAFTPTRAAAPGLRFRSSDQGASFPLGPSPAREARRRNIARRW